MAESKEQDQQASAAMDARSVQLLDRLESALLGCLDEPAMLNLRGMSLPTAVAMRGAGSLRSDLSTFTFNELLEQLRRHQMELESLVERRTGELRREIHERSRAEAQVKDSEAMYRALAESAQESIFVIGSDYTLQYCNEYGCRMYGRPVERLLGLPLRQLFPPDTVDAQIANIRRVFETGQMVRAERAFPLNGLTVWLDTRLVPLRTGDDEIRAVMGISRDITVRKTLELTLQESLENYRQLFFGSFEGIVVHDQGVILECNAAIEQMFGRRREEVLGTHVLEYVDPAFRARVGEYVRAGREAPYAAIALHRDGSRNWMYVLGRGIRFNRKPSRLVGMRFLRRAEPGEGPDTPPPV